MFVVIDGGFVGLSGWVCSDVSGSGGGWVFKNIFLYGVF